MKRRSFFNFAGKTLAVAALFEVVRPYLESNQAQAQTWVKLGAADSTTASKVRFPQYNGRRRNTIGCGDYHSMIIRSDGFVFTCGDNNKGQLGDNSTTSRLTFIQATGISNAIAVISCGYRTTMALRSDGFVFGAGYNWTGQLGDNTNGTSSKSTFVQAIGISNAMALAAGDSHTVALRSDGRVFACGYNGTGQLGDNTLTSRSTFVQAIGISNAVAIAAGRGQTLALRSDGLVFGCGGNGTGTGTIMALSTFAQATGISNAIAIACGGYHSVALRSDGLIFATGSNAMGQLGDNTTTNKSTFIQSTGP